MRNIFTFLILTIFSISSFAKTNLPTEYTLTNSDYKLVGNGKYNNFDVRTGKSESDPLVILSKLNTILDKNFEYKEGDAIQVTFAIYNGSKSTDTWNMYVENLKFRTTEYVLGGSSHSGYENLGTTTTLDICTWNIEHYPKNYQSEEKVKNIILDSKLDVFALQEISDDDGDFRSLLQELGSNYSGFIYNPKIDNDIKWDQNIAFIYKKDEISVVKPAHEISEFKGDSYAFPRLPYEVTFKHKSGVEFVIINIHLKCCNGSEARRLSATKKIKKYIDENYTTSNTKVVLLGDMNDRIDSGESNNVFNNFINDANYYFVDTKVSEESKNGTGWANIDHILINKPLFEANNKDASKLKKSDFEFNYDAIVSDHFPVWVNLNAEILGNDVNYIYKSKLNLYPNPVGNNFLKIDLPQNIKVEEIKIIDITGKEVLSTKKADTNLDVSKLSTGSYIITVKSNHTLYTGNFIKK